MILRHLFKHIILMGETHVYLYLYLYLYVYWQNVLGLHHAIVHNYFLISYLFICLLALYS